MASQKRRADEMFPLIASYLKTGLPQKTFCQQHQLPYAVFLYWLKRYKTEHPKSSELAPGKEKFVPVNLRTHSEVSSAACEIRFPSGVTIRFGQPVDAKTLLDLIHTGNS